MKIFWRAIYCTKPRPNPRSQSGSWYHKGLGRKAPRFMQEYDVSTAILIRPLTQLRTCERVPWVFSLRVYSNSWVQLVLPTQVCHPLRGQTEKNISVSNGSDYRVYHHFPYPNGSGAYPLVSSCRYLCSSLQIGHQLWYQSGFPIFPEWVRHLMSPICSPPDIPPPFICCGPGELGVCRIHR